MLSSFIDIQSISEAVGVHEEVTMMSFFAAGFFAVKYAGKGLWYCTKKAKEFLSNRPKDMSKIRPEFRLILEIPASDYRWAKTHNNTWKYDSLFFLKETGAVQIENNFYPSHSLNKQEQKAVLGLYNQLEERLRQKELLALKDKVDKRKTKGQSSGTVSGKKLPTLMHKTDILASNLYRVTLSTPYSKRLKKGDILYNSNVDQVATIVSEL